MKEGSWNSINKDSFVGLIEYLKYGIPSMMMTFLEFCAYEVINIMAAYLGALELGASVILFNIICYMYMVISGFSFASSSLVGNSLGASQPKNARIYANISL